MAQRHRSANSALRSAVEHASVDDVRTALDAGANPQLEWDDEDDLRTMPAAYLVRPQFSLLRAGDVALQDRAVACLRLLHEHGGIEEAEASELLVTAVTNGCGPAMAQVFLDAGADVRYTLNGLTALPQALWADTARVLIGAGASVNDKHLLHLAVRYSRQPVEHVRLLLGAGADVDTVDHVLGTPLCCALRHCQPAHMGAVVALLLEAGADPLMPSIGFASSVDLLVQLLANRYASKYLHRYTRKELAAQRAVAPLVVRAAAWRRRRHMLLAVVAGAATAALCQ